MYGAILGDIIGSPYEFDEQNIKTKDFPLFSPESRFTDDSVMTIAVASAFIKVLLCRRDDNWMLRDYAEEKVVNDLVTANLKYWGNEYPDAGYGRRFIDWLAHGDGPYNSYGNGSAMRVSSAGWLFDTLDETIKMAGYSAEVTHNHPEGIKGAKAVAAAIYMARTGASKEEIKEYMESNFWYDLSRTVDEIRPGYHHVETCQGTVPEAITAFLEGEDFEDVIRTAVSLGGDCDTLTCIAGSMAEAFYGVPEELKEECSKRITPDMRNVLDRFDELRK